MDGGTPCTRPAIRGGNVCINHGGAETGKDIWLCGGSKLAAAVLPEIDELILKINPVVIGAGIPLFDGFTGTRKATIVEHNAYSNGFILARYALCSLSSSHAIDPTDGIVSNCASG